MIDTNNGIMVTKWCRGGCVGDGGGVVVVVLVVVVVVVASMVMVVVVVENDLGFSKIINC